MNMKAADQLLYQITMDTRRAMDPEGTLYVVIGETHTAPSHILLHAGLIDRIACTYEETQDPSLKPLVTLELPYNFLPWYAQTVYKLGTATIHSPGKIQKKDPLGHIFTRAVRANNDMTYAPRSINARLDTILRHEIPVVLVDTAVKLDKSGVKLICPKDKLSRSIAKEFYDLNLAKENTCYAGLGDPTGMEVRNDVMAVRTAEAAKKHQAGVVMMQIGNAHFGGHQKFDELSELLGIDIDDVELPFETSYPALLAHAIKEKDRIISVFCEHADNEVIPDTNIAPHDNAFITTVVLRGLANKRFKAGENKAEQRFIKQLGRSYPRTERPAYFKPTITEDKKNMVATLEDLLGTPSV